MVVLLIHVEPACRPGIFANGLDEACQGRGHAPAGYGDEIDLPPYVRLDDGTKLKAWKHGAEFRNEADAQAARDHVLDPILSLALITNMDCPAGLANKVLDIVLILAVQAKQLILAMHFRHPHGILACETMACRAG